MMIVQRASLRKSALWRSGTQYACTDRRCTHRFCLLYTNNHLRNLHACRQAGLLFLEPNINRSPGKRWSIAIAATDDEEAEFNLPPVQGSAAHIEPCWLEYLPSFTKDKDHQVQVKIGVDTAEKVHLTLYLRTN